MFTKIDPSFFSFRDKKAKSQTHKTDYQEYLEPCFYVEIYLDETENKPLHQLYQACLDEIGSGFTHHANTKQPKIARFKDRDKALAFFPDFLDSKDIHVWCYLSNKENIADASFEAWIHKKKPDHQKQEVIIKNHKEILKHYQTDMLPHSITPISYLKISFPLDHFKSAEAFLKWILALDILKNGAFFSATAGYKIKFWEGNKNKAAEEKLASILTDYPGFDFDLAIGNSMGRRLSKDQSQIIPQIKRVNWVTCINHQAIEWLGELGKLKKEMTKDPSIQLHSLKKGTAIQAGPSPEIQKTRLNHYHFVGKLLSSIHYKRHEKDHFYIPSDTVAKKWLYLFDS